jgi:TonB family protein
VIVMLAACWTGAEAPPPQAPAQSRAPVPAARVRAEAHDDGDDGDVTVLHTRPWKFAGYFNRLKAQVAAHWFPTQTWNGLSPQMRAVYGTATRTLVVELSLDDNGDVHNIAIVAPSGVPDLDTQTLVEIMNAAPFEAPPPELRPLTFRLMLALDVVQQSAAVHLTP